MELIIAEKPQVANAIAEAIGNGSKAKGYIECNNTVITWCIGHLLNIKFPSEGVQWIWDNLPVTSDGWSFEINENTKEQYFIVTELIKKADTIVNAGDPDDEGQLIVDSLLYKNGIIDLKGNSKKEIKRLLINDFNTAVIAKQLKQLKDNNDYLDLSLAAIARKIADKVFGYNMTMAYTIKNRELGNLNNIISIGRVQTPMLGLIVRRDQEVQNHKKSFFYKVKGLWQSLNFNYVAKEEEVDENKRIISESVAEEILQRISNNKDKAVISKYTNKEEVDNVPLPYNLLDLQADCSKYYNMKPEKVKIITQNLREKYKAITYNRSDCNYLLDETYDEAPDIINMLQIFTDDALVNIINNADITIKSKAFDSSKTSAHTAIIPTITDTSNYEKFNDEERKVFLLIAKRFVMQFLPPAKYIKHIITIQIEDDVLENTHRQEINPGWKAIVSLKEEVEEERTININYEELKENVKVEPIEFSISKEETKPKKLYTIESFLQDLKRVSVYCKDDKIKKLLKDKDKGKTGESGGIGTPATRDTIIKILYDRGYIVDDKKNVISTKLGQDLIASLSETITYPDITALWHEDIKEIGKSFEAVNSFIKEVTNFSVNEINDIKSKDLKVEVNAEICPICSSPLKRLKSKKGSFFWICSNEHIYNDNKSKPDLWIPQECPICNGQLLKYNGQYGKYWKCNNKECSKTYPDKNNKPDFSEKQKPTISEVYKCMECGKGLKRLESKKKKGSFFWACSNYPECKSIYQDKDGKPVYNK